MLQTLPIYLTPQLAQIRRQLYREHRRQAKLAGQRYGAIVSSLLQRTTRHWGDSGENRSPKPQPKVTIKIKGNERTGVTELSVKVLMVDSSGKPHFIWHILSQGRRAYTFPAGKRTPVLKERKRRRTRKGTLSVDPFGGFTGETFVIHGGQRVRAVEGNEWYEAAADIAQQQAAKDPLLKEFPAEFQIVPMRRGS